MSHLTKVGNSYFLLIPKHIIDENNLINKKFKISFKDDVLFADTTYYRQDEIIINYLKLTLKLDERYLKSMLTFQREVFCIDDDKILASLVKNLCKWIDDFDLSKCIKETVFTHFIPSFLHEKQIEFIYKEMKNYFNEVE